MDCTVTESKWRQRQRRTVTNSNERKHKLAVYNITARREPAEDPCIAGEDTTKYENGIAWDTIAYGRNISQWFLYSSSHFNFERAAFHNVAYCGTGPQSLGRPRT